MSAAGDIRPAQSNSSSAATAIDIAIVDTSNEKISLSKILGEPK
jgi:hypothetical protein